MRTWIIDGHNVIFSTEHLKQLQVSGRREEARRRLEQTLREFLRRRQAGVLVVYDGNDQPDNPDAMDEPGLRTVYARRGDGEADDRIIHEARVLREAGGTVTVVTDDVSTLGSSLPAGTERLSVEEFWHLLRTDRAGGRQGADGKRISGEFGDIERDMVARAGGPEADPAALTLPPPVPSAAPEPATGASSIPAAPRPRAAVAGPAADRDAILEKRDRGRRLQERRLRLRPARRSKRRR